MQPGAGFDVTDYRVTLTPDFAGKSLAGTEEITLRSVADGLAAIAFSPNALEIREATLDGKPVVVSRREDAIVFTLPAPLRAAHPATLRFRYEGVPARGVTFGADSVHSAYWSCDWMICLQDSPGDKARIDVSLRLPRGMVSLGPGRLVSKVKSADFEIHRWRAAHQYSPYLFAFAAGRFASVQDGFLTYFGPSGTATGELRNVFAPTSAMVRFFSGKAGLPLPERHYAQLIVPGSEAQEAVAQSALGEEEIAALRKDPAEDWAIAHELAHQWWGNLVTCKSWSEFWLNEGITVFMTAAWKEQAHGRAAYDAEMALARKRWMRAKEAGWDKPLAFAGTYPSIGMRRAIQYSKGALFLDHLRAQLGERAFWAGLKRYTRAHAGGTVESRDFQRAMEKASGQDLSAPFAEWVYGA